MAREKHYFAYIISYILGNNCTGNVADTNKLNGLLPKQQQNIFRFRTCLLIQVIKQESSLFRCVFFFQESSSICNINLPYLRSDHSPSSFGTSPITHLLLQVHIPPPCCRPWSHTFTDYSPRDSIKARKGRNKINREDFYPQCPGGSICRKDAEAPPPPPQRKKKKKKL